MRIRLLIWDLVAVAVFVVLGRRTHQESETLRAILITAAPFTGALTVGWFAALRRNPISLRGGLVVTGITIAGGMLLRRFVAGEGIATPFILVTTLFLTATMLGWRIAFAWWSGRHAAMATTSR
jgi:hypothetical protein